ncbi:uncharacterized protein Ecym_8014 [Eremothecium cymbalariae DBVPG|uniref:ABC transporter domain-containing protein n=1 Tax=Eremothecium cymbalariae (strain CBS 270.75 / DBVPG 7215 / KCTC 17166 / NRRL Y-17582) TaxID=931890 RepID=G8JWT6_ERECY|nr:Hypothetical protein Ecym_8014 [Eremothecium cymbalariae DBVPG\
MESDGEKEKQRSMSTQDLSLESPIELNNDTAHIYTGINSEENMMVKELARTLTNTSARRQQDNRSGSAHLYSLTSAEYGVNPVYMDESNPGYDPRLDPTSDHFSSEAWTKNMSRINASDASYYKPYSLGCMWRNLSAYGNSADVAYQSTIYQSVVKAVSSMARQFRGNKHVNTVDILKPMDGLVKPNELLVVLGRPGSGCTTLLKSISSNTHGFYVGEDAMISYDGLTPKQVAKNYRGAVVYTAEVDVHIPHLTVFQTLYNVALLATPVNRIKGVDRETYAKHITEVTMATYGLSHTKNTKVGNDFIRGVSGGERKRVSIAEVSICGSKFQCWDNATRGLDSATALEFVKALRVNADLTDSAGVVAIYQCSEEIYTLFDKVCILYEGRQIFFGSTKEAKQYFLDLGYICPPRQATADFLTAITNPSERIINEEFLKAQKYVPVTPKEMEICWKQSDQYKRLLQEIDSYATNESEQGDLKLKQAHCARQSKSSRSSSPYISSFNQQVKYLTTRNIQRAKATMEITLFQIIGNIVMPLIIGSMFYKAMKPNDATTFYSRGAAMFYGLLFNAFSSLLEINALYEIRPVTEKHKRYALYHPGAEALASIMSEIPIKITISVTFNLVYYFMVNFRRDAGTFFFFYLIVMLSTFAMSHLFRCVGAATKTLPQAMIPASIILLILAMYVGFAVPKTKILGWSKWLFYINPLTHAFESLMINEFHGREFQCANYVPSGPLYQGFSSDNRVCAVVGSVPGSDKVLGDRYIELSYGYLHSHKWRSVPILLAYIFFFLIVYLLLCEYNESAKQNGEILVFPKSVVNRLKKENKLNQKNADDEEKSLGIEPISDSKLIRSSTGRSNLETTVGLSKSQAIFHWRNVCYSVKIKDENRLILDHVDGWVKPGTLTALMGASGAGKTTLLDCLASRVTTGVLTGSMFVNGNLRDKSFPRSIGYCQQQDLHLSTATVKESLRFSAYLRQSADIPKEEKDRYVDEVIKILDMEQYVDAVVGVAGEGLNVEQRKRLTIGVELVAKPKLLLFLDEPTSGLDSQTAWSICQLMRSLADHGQAVLCTIHQPSALLMQEFDRLLLLQKHGQTVYFGDLGDGCSTMIKYFEDHGAEPCDKNSNPADWMLRVIDAAPGSTANQDYHEVWKNSKEYEEVQKELSLMEQELPKRPLDTSSEQTEFATGFPYQVKLVTSRLWQQYWRTPSYIWSKFFVAIISSLFVGFTFFKSDLSMQGLQNQMLSIFMLIVVFNPILQQYLPVFVSQRNLYESREQHSRTFSWKSFLVAQLIVEIPWNVIVGTLSFFCYYYAVGLYNSASVAHQLTERGLLFWLFSIIYYVYVGSAGQAAIAGVQNIESAGNLASMVFTLCLSFCGVMVSRKNLPRFWIFMYRISPFTYMVDGMLSVAVANVDVRCSDYEYIHFNAPAGQTCQQYTDAYMNVAGGYLSNPNSTTDCSFCPISSTNAFLSSVDCSYSHRWRNIGISVAYILLNYFIFLGLYWLTRVPKKRPDLVESTDADRPSSS